MTKLSCTKNSLLISLTLMLLTGCGGSDDSGGDSSSDDADGTSVSSTSITSITTCIPTGDTVTISGTIYYERVPMSSLTTSSSDYSYGNGLDYNNIETLPVRGVVIQALGDDDCVMAKTDTSSSGAYFLDVEQNTDVKIQVQAKLYSTDTASWDFEVRDNTSSNGLYVLEGSLSSSGTEDSVRNLTADSGWGGSSYTSSRDSGPFAILDSIYEAVMLVVDADPDVSMDDADIFWSVNNTTAYGDTSLGEIGTSYYTNDTIYILGDEDNDTDEFDEHVIVHEWGHYFEDNLSRSDSIGGSHSLSNILDMRIALGEGFGNAFSAMVLEDSVYKDSFYSAQAASFGFDVDENSNTNPGWFSEGSVQSILYDLYDSDNDGADVVSLGFSPIYEAMTSTAYIDQSSMTSIFSLINRIQTLNSSVSLDIDALVEEQQSSTLLGIDAVADNYGSTETHEGYSGTYVSNIPIYQDLTDDGSSVEVCSHDIAQEFNGLGTRQFVRLSIDSAGKHEISVAYSQGDISSLESAPGVVLYFQGVYLGWGYEDGGLFEVDVIFGAAAEYILEVFDYNNLDQSSSTGGSVCFDVSVTGS